MKRVLSFKLCVHEQVEQLKAELEQAAAAVKEAERRREEAAAAARLAQGQVRVRSAHATHPAVSPGRQLGLLMR
jgi:hypothetical protein